MDGHIIDPTFFYDAIDEFAFNYEIFRKCEVDEIDEYGRAKPKYKKDIISGSFQVSDSNKSRNTSGNTNTETADFYCKSLYRVNKDDIIKRNDIYYICNGIHNYDEWGVREARFSMINWNENRDFKEWLEYQYGGKIV